MKDITVIHEDEFVVVIYKPVGLAVHGFNAQKIETVADWFVATYKEAVGVGEQMVSKDGTTIERSGIVHRLDRDTSGVMVLAKTQESYEYLKEQFQARTVQKEYRAFVYGHMNEKWGTIDRPIGRNASDFRKRSAQRGAKGTLRDAVTDWELLGQGEHEGEPFAYVKLRPKTGRMHQLRVHLKAIDRPIVGDVLYAGAKLEQSHNLGLKRLALHAHTLSFTTPDGETHRCIAPVPIEFEVAADMLHEAE